MYEAKAEKLPGHVRRMASGGLACMHCGGEVDGDGLNRDYESEGEEEDSGPDTIQEGMADELFAKAVGGRR